MTEDRFTAPFHATMTLIEAREVLRPRAEKGGESCPCCTQMVRLYRRRLSAVPARALAHLYADHGLESGHLPTVAEKHMRRQAHQGGYISLTAHWGLMADDGIRRTDGGRGGYWRVTDLGERWLLGEATVETYALIFDGRCLGLAGAPLAMEDVLGTGFDLGALMTASRDAQGTTGGGSLFDSQEAA